MKLQFFVVYVDGGIDPSIQQDEDGNPIVYHTVADQNAAAKALDATREWDSDDCIFWLDLDENGVPHIGSYSGAFFDEILTDKEG